MKKKVSFLTSYNMTFGHLGIKLLMKRNILKYVLLTLTVMTGAVLSSANATSPLLFHEGTDYITLKHAHSQTPEIIQFFSFHCRHCRAFEPIMDQLRVDLPEQTTIKRIPVAYGSTRSVGKLLQQSYAFTLSRKQLQQKPTITQANNDFMDHLFDEIQLNLKRPSSPSHAYDIALEQINTAMERSGFSSKDIALFKESINDFSLVQQAENFTKAANTYRVQNVPTIIVNGKYQIAPNAMNSPERFQALVKFLLTLKTG